MNVKRSLGWSTAVIAALGITLSPASAAGALTGSSKPQPPPTLGRYETMDERLARLQEPLSAAANRLYDAASAGGAQGYAGITVDVEGQGVNLFWKGDPPQAVVTALAAERKSVRVRSLSALHAKAELLEDVTQIVADESARNVPREKRAHALSISPDGSGITVTVEARDAAEEARRSQRNVIVTNVASDSVHPLTRQNDSPPWWSGARIYVGGGGCTTGFGVYSGSAQWMITAAHCASQGSTAYDGAYDLMGSVGTVIPGIDTELINLSSPNVGGYMYDGAWNDPNSYAKPVVGRAANFVGEYVCTSGSYSGVQCDLQINADNESRVINGVNVRSLIRAARTDGSFGAGTGDSGGPVFSVSPSDGYANVTARGGISLGEGSPVSCTAGVAGTCYNQIIYMPISVIVNTFGVSLMTAPPR